MNKIYLTKRELDIMNVFWKEKKPLIASNLPKFNPSLTVNTVQGYLKKLKEKGLIEVDSIVYSGTVLTRSYKTTMDQEEFERKNYLNSMDLHKFSVSSLVTVFLNDKGDTTEEELTNLEKLIQERKRLIKENRSKEK